jgi:hypothetical protein
MSNVIRIHASREPDDILEEMKGRLQSVIVFGWDDKGQLQGEASADMSEAEVIFIMRLMERAVIDSVVGE